MKFVFKKYYWFFVAIGIVINIIIFIFVSNKLENYVAGDLISKQNISEV